MSNNAQHLSQTGEWYTPPEWTEIARASLGGIDLDPCGNEDSNVHVRADIYLSDGLGEWPNYGTAFVNPPGCCERHEGQYAVCGNTKRCSCKLPRKFLEKCVDEAATKNTGIVYLAYSVNQLRILSNIAIASNVKVAIAMPPSRIPYIDPATMQPQHGTNCDSAFILLNRASAKPFYEAGCRIYHMAGGGLR